MSSCFALACRFLRITDKILYRSDCMIQVSSSERSKYERKSRRDFSVCTGRRLVFVAFDFRGLDSASIEASCSSWIYSWSSISLIHANVYIKILKHISQIAAILLEGDAGLSIVVLCTQILNLWQIDDPTLDPATSNDPPARTVPALS